MNPLLSHLQPYPFERLRDAAPDLVISINASPSHVGKREQRHEVFTQAAARHKLAILYINQIGGQDQIVFDGASFAVEPEAGLVFEARRFEEDVCTLELNAQGRFQACDGQTLPTVPAQGLATMEFYRQQIVLGLRDYARRFMAHASSRAATPAASTAPAMAYALSPD